MEIRHKEEHQQAWANSPFHCGTHRRWKTCQTSSCSHCRALRTCRMHRAWMTFPAQWNALQNCLLSTGECFVTRPFARERGSSWLHYDTNLHFQVQIAIFMLTNFWSLSIGLLQQLVTWPKLTTWPTVAKGLLHFTRLENGVHGLWTVYIVPGRFQIRKCGNPLLPSSTSTFSQPLKDKCISEVVRIDWIIIIHLSKLWKAKFFMLCGVIFLVRLQGKFEIDHSSEWKGWHTWKHFYLRVIHFFIAETYKKRSLSRNERQPGIRQEWWKYGGMANSSRPRENIPSLSQVRICKIILLVCK